MKVSIAMVAVLLLRTSSRRAQLGDDIMLGIRAMSMIYMKWLTNSWRRFLCLVLGCSLIFTLGCLEPKLDNTSPQPTASPLKPSTIGESIRSSEVFPNEKQVIDYIINQKSIQANDIQLLNFAKIEKINSIYTTEKPYFTGDYVAVRMLIKNYTVITMEYKDSDHLFVEENYSAVSEKEKEVFDMLIKYKLDSFYFGNGQLTPTRITFHNATNAEFIMKFAE